MATTAEHARQIWLKHVDEYHKLFTSLKPFNGDDLYLARSMAILDPLASKGARMYEKYLKLAGNEQFITKRVALNDL